jgi:hypothetical protein
METAAAVWTDRHIPLSAIIDQCRGLSDVGVVVDWVAPFDDIPIMNGDADGGVRRMVGLCSLLRTM